MPDQPELRQRLAEAIEQHLICECGDWADNMTENCSHIAQALLALPGIAIVDLPTQVSGCWPVVVTGEPEQVYLSKEPEAWADPERIICISGMGYVYVNEARSVAAALLAAAGVAEERTNARP